MKSYAPRRRKKPYSRFWGRLTFDARYTHKVWREPRSDTASPQVFTNHAFPPYWYHRAEGRRMRFVPRHCTLVKHRSDLGVLELWIEGQDEPRSGYDGRVYGWPQR